MPLTVRPRDPAHETSHAKYLRTLAGEFGMDTTIRGTAILKTRAYLVKIEEDLQRTEIILRDGAGGEEEWHAKIEAAAEAMYEIVIKLAQAQGQSMKPWMVVRLEPFGNTYRMMAAAALGLPLNSPSPIQVDAATPDGADQQLAAEAPHEQQDGGPHGRSPVDHQDGPGTGAGSEPGTVH